MTLWSAKVRRAPSGLASGLALAVRPGQCAASRLGYCDILPATGALGAMLTAWPWCWRARQRDTAGTAGGRSSGWPCAAARRAVGLASEGRGESCRPATARPPGELRPPTAGHPGRSFALGCSRPTSPFTAGAVRPGAPKVRP